ncbi:hypothetical protein GCM10010340_21960 [Streptomyces griseoloalbus]|nr:hypothetical protein GCM10010340_21960 [Streptomyces albaduncus]
MACDRSGSRDALLQRQQDASLWRDADLAYVVIDEFHTCDGAQGTDVAMLLRRLAAVAGAAEEGRPLGSICPVGPGAGYDSRAPSRARRFPCPCAGKGSHFSRLDDWCRFMKGRRRGSSGSVA